MNSLDRAFALCLAALAATTAVRADDDRGVLRIAPLPAYRQECSACHIAYAPALLPAACQRPRRPAIGRCSATTRCAAAPARGVTSSC